MGYLIGIDVGTSGTRALVVDERGLVLGSASAPHTSLAPRPLWSEQEPEEWWQATQAAVPRALADAGIEPDAVAGIGLTGQMHGLVMLDADDEVIRPAILWNDQRTAAECREIRDAVGPDRLREITCNPALTGFTAPKILWVRKNEPSKYARCRRMLLPKDYVRFRMSGAYATDVSDASGTLLLDVGGRDWSDEVLGRLDLDRALLPDCFESPEVCAQLSKEGAEALGLPAGTPIVGGGGDQAAGAVGNGVVREGVISATIGTSGVVFAVSKRAATDPAGRLHTFCHAVPGMWHVMGVVLSAGGSLQWYRDNLANAERTAAERLGLDPYDVMCEEAARAPAGCEGLLFLPYLTGERTPHADPNARGVLFGLTPRHGKAECIRSIMEGITYAMRDSLEIIRSLEVQVDQIRLSGGGARSKLWRQMQADCYGQTVCTINAEEGPAYGAALLAGVGTGAWPSVEAACEQCIRVTDAYEPVAEHRAAYDEYYPLYRALYTSLREQFGAVTETVERLSPDQ